MKKKSMNALANVGAAAIPKPKASPARAPEYEAQERKYRAEDALRTLTRAKEIERDRPLMRDVKACAKEQMKTLANVTGRKK